MKDLIDNVVESGAIYYFIAAAIIVAVGIYIDLGLFDECKAHGFSTFYCLMK